MDKISLEPDKKLRTKIYLIFTSISLLIILIAIILQFTIPLGGKTTYAQVAFILWPIAIGVIFGLFIIGIPIALLWIDRLEYVIDEERITLKKGIITKIEQNIPFRAITDFQLHRSFFDRFLHIGSIRIQTAGQSATPTGYEGNLAGLKGWQSMLEELRSRVKESRENSNSETKNLVKSDEPDKLTAILEELKQIRKVLENK